MNINCREVAERYLLNQNPLYTFSFPLSLLIAIIIYGVAKAFKWSDNSYLIQILFPVLALLLSMVIFDLIARQMIPKKERNSLMSECQTWYNKPKNPFYPIENFISPEQPKVLNDEKELQIKEEHVLNEKVYVEAPLADIPNIFPQPIESRPEGNLCIQNSNCCSLCSGSEDSNPCKLIAPIPGPQWIPQSAKAVQDRLVNEDYTKAVCNFSRKY